MSARLLALVVAFTVIGPATNALAGMVLAPAATAAEPQLEISGTVSDLAPGRPVTVEVRISNPSTASAAVRIMGLTATVSDAITSCSAENVRVTSYHWTAAGRTYSAAPGTRVVVPLTMTLLDTATSQDACQGARFPINFRVQATSI